MLAVLSEETADSDSESSLASDSGLDDSSSFYSVSTIISTDSDSITSSVASPVGVQALISKTLLATSNNHVLFITVSLLYLKYVALKLL